MANYSQITVLDAEHEDDFEVMLMQLHHQIVAESISDVYSGHSRCEKLVKVNGVNYYNDSLSKSISDVVDALKFIPNKNIIWIMNESDDIDGLHKLGSLIESKVVGIICIGDHNNQTMLKLLNYAPTVLSAASTTEAVELSLFFNANIDAVIFSPGSPIYAKKEKNQDQGHLFKKAVKTIELNTKSI